MLSFFLKITVPSFSCIAVLVLPTCRLNFYRKSALNPFCPAKIKPGSLKFWTVLKVDGLHVNFY